MRDLGALKVGEGGRAENQETEECLKPRGVLRPGAGAVTSGDDVAERQQVPRYHCPLGLMTER